MTEMQSYFWSCILAAAFVMIPILGAALISWIKERREQKQHDKEIEEALRFYGRSISHKKF